MAKQEPQFEEALAKLEQIVSAIERGEVSLEESIDKYAQGVKLIKQCRKILDTAEKKIKLLTEADGGVLTATDELDEAQ